MTKRDGNASDHLLTQAAATPQDELVAGLSGTPESILPQALLAQVLDRANLRRALKQVRQNKGAPGLDGMTVEALPDYLRHHWPEIREQLEMGGYRPQPVKRVEIEKADGKKRPLGIPTVLDRFIQQAIAQVVSAQWEPSWMRLHNAPWFMRYGKRGRVCHLSPGFVNLFCVPGRHGRLRVRHA
jgi:RNA-directed DNA polymerase